MLADKSNMLPRAGIYAIRHIASGMMYIGSAIDISDRWRSHRKSLAKGCHHSCHLQRAWHKHGPAAFVFEVLEAVADPAELIRVEQEYIDRFQSARWTRGYNVSPTAGSQLGFRHSDRTRARLAAAKANLSDETRARLAAAKSGRRQSDETRARRSAAMKGREKIARSCREDCCGEARSRALTGAPGQVVGCRPQPVRRDPGQDVGSGQGTDALRRDSC